MKIKSQQCSELLRFLFDWDVSPANVYDHGIVKAAEKNAETPGDDFFTKEVQEN